MSNAGNIRVYRTDFQNEALRNEEGKIFVDQHDHIWKKLDLINIDSKMKLREVKGAHI